ncbi:2Fe-2S iron-sulfur cluster-binding protein [Oligoflexus tunisiensis]|uniref:2Fe-2S iron-sulfur cluster-binding protein n=1 Tax=Oligoflexus tunisiensis TaxID=708132 RepID=UPI00114CF934|nr:2Fe-2S iron-sulfur cluster-binding protein [Oligoflexus tunisiensis]
MPRILFTPAQKFAEVDPNTKILLAGRKAGVNVRFGCASCRCGTCGVKITEGADQLSPMKTDEEKLLKRLKLPLDGTVRLACQARINGDCEIDLDFQDTYNPEDINFLDEDD